MLVHESLAEGVAGAAAEYAASMVLVGQRSAAATIFGSSGEVIATATPAAVAIPIGEGEKIDGVRLLGDGSADGGPDGDAERLARELASRVAGHEVAAPAEGDGAVGRLSPASSG